MAAVKGSKQYRMKVVRHQPLRTFCLRLAVVLLLVASAAGAWWYGRLQGLRDGADALRERELLRTELASLQANHADLRAQLTSLEQTTTLDRETLGNLQRTILSLREMNSQLQEDVLFYKQIMSPENDEMGLVIGQLDLRETGATGEVRFRIELKQQGNNEDTLEGFANVNVLGMQNGMEVSLPLRSLSDAVVELDIPLQFRYFQNIEGVLRLPAEFQPQKVQILATAESPTEKTVQQSFSWIVQP